MEKNKLDKQLEKIEKDFLLIKEQNKKAILEAPLPKFKPGDIVLVKKVIGFYLKDREDCRIVASIIFGQFYPEDKVWVYAIMQHIGIEKMTESTKAVEEDLEKI